MMWFWFALITLICWSGSDLFSKIGCRDGSDKNAHLKMVMAVGVIMGLHAAYEVFFNGVYISWDIILTYLPVSACYILSMAFSFFGMRFIEESISDPIENTSGAMCSLLCVFMTARIISGVITGTRSKPFSFVLAIHLTSYPSFTASLYALSENIPDIA